MRYQLPCTILLSLAGLLWAVQPSGLVLAETQPPPQPVSGPRQEPAPVPNTAVINGDQLYNDLVYPDLPLAAQQADIADGGRHQHQPGQGVSDVATRLGSGLTLQATSQVCNDFNQRSRWASQGAHPSDLWSDHYAGWGAFAQDDGHFYRANNVIFSFEQTVGPGRKAGAEQYAAKIASGQPYAAGFGSPLLAVTPGATVVVTVKYLIFDHDTAGQDFDWVSLGLKPDATRPPATYVNGYRRGQWAELTHRVKAGNTGKIMVLVQAQSPAALNSNIYFDDVTIAINGQYLTSCLEG
jgi:hypothetical protein